MSIVGTRQEPSKGTGMHKHRLYGFAKTFNEAANSILNETAFDIYSEPIRAVRNESALDTLENFFIDESCHEDHLSPEEIQEHRDMMKESFLNQVEAIKEYAPVNSFNPVMGMVFPLYKNLLMNTIWDKGIIDKAVAVSPKTTLTMEQRILVDVDGNEIDLFRNQKAIKAAMDKVAPFVDVDLSLPEVGDTDVLDAMGLTPKDNLSIETHISKFTTAAGTFETNIVATPSYNNQYDRIAMVPVEWQSPVDPAADPVVYETKSDVITFAMKNSTITVSALKGEVTAVTLSAKKDTSNGLVNTPTPKWDTKTDIIEIGTGVPINTTISPEEVKDVSKLYNVDQLTKLMGIIKDVMSNFKDDTIKEHVDKSWAVLDADSKETGSFDFAPPTGYMLDHVTWRRATFMDYVDSMCTELLNKLNDPNMVISFVGRPDIIRKITPTSYEYKAPGSIGPVKLDFQQTIVTSDDRTYQFISSQKIDGDEIIVMVRPTTNNRIIYRIYDYQLYASNEIRNAANPTLPAIHTFERWKFKEYQPIQGRLTIQNPSGMRP